MKRWYKAEGLAVTAMSIKQKVWRLRRDGVRQRYTVAIGGDEFTRSVGKQLVSALQSGDYETFLHLIQIPRVREIIDKEWERLITEISGRFEDYFRMAMLYAGRHAKPLIDALFLHPWRTEPTTGETVSAAPLILRIIGQLGLTEYGRRIYDHYIRPPSQQAIIKAMVKDYEEVPVEDYELVSSAIRAAAQLGEPSVRSVIEVLLKAHEDNWPVHQLVAECIPLLWPRHEAIQMLSKQYERFERKQSNESLIYLAALARLHSTRHAEIIHSTVHKAIDYIAQGGGYDPYATKLNLFLRAGYPPKMFDELVRILEKSIASYQLSAIIGLGEMRDPRAIPYLLPYVMDEQARDNLTMPQLLAVLEALSKLRATEYIDAEQANALLDRYVSILRELDRHWSPLMPWAAYNPYDCVGDLVRMRDPRALPIIERHLEQESRPSYRVALLHAYAGLGGAEAVPFLTARFDKERPQVQSAIVRALRRINTPDAQRFLRSIPNNPNASDLAKLTLMARSA